MQITIDLNKHKLREYEYFLQKKFNSEAKLPQLVKNLVLLAVTEGAQKESSEAENLLLTSEK